MVKIFLAFFFAKAVEGVHTTRDSYYHREKGAEKMLRGGGG